MTSGLKSGTAIFAILAGVGFGALPVSAADLGGNCCADLEERIAELEATTARKGNRKVKLEVSGHVNEALFAWDDGFEQNASFYTNDNSRSRFRFKGTGKINEDLKAGYLLEIGVRTQNSKRFTQNNPSGEPQTGLDIRHSTWYLDSKSLGQAWVGKTAPAAEGITEINQAQTGDVAKFTDVEDSALGLGVRTTAGILVTEGAGGALLGFRRAIRDTGDQPGEPERGSIVKYVSPEFGGFVASAAWGGDDYWDMALRYKGEFWGLKVAAGIAYGAGSGEGGDERDQIANCNQSSSPNTRTTPQNQGVDCEQVGGSISVMHPDSGLYVNFGAGQSVDHNAALLFNATGDDESTFYAIEAGIERKFVALGKTTIFGQWYDADTGSTGRAFTVNGGVDGRIASADLEMFGGGVVQGIDAAAMSLYLYYRHVEADFTLRTTAGAALATPALEDLDMIVAGGIIKF